MRSLGEADWFDYRVDVPLTGREPVTLRLRNRLKRRGPGWGWVTIQGPAGSGVTRMLKEAAVLVRGDAGPQPVWIRPVVDTDVPLEALRRALAPLFAGMTAAVGARQLQAMLSGPEADVDTLASWLLAGPLDTMVARPSLAAARRLLERVVPGGLVIVDDFDLLDERTQAVLLPSVDHQGPGVIAGISGDPKLAPPATLWGLDPLTAPQVELLLKRWLRNTATARRLAPQLVKRYGGWPGRMVEAIRTLGRDGRLVREPRGMVVKTLPKRWPDGVRPEGAFLAWARALGAPAARLLDLAALQGEPISTPLLAEAAGVKQSFVEAVRAEAAAVRDGALPGRFFASHDAAEQQRAALDIARKQELGARLAAAWDRRPTNHDETACAALGRVVGYLCGDRREDALLALPAAMTLLAASPVATDCDVRRIVRVGTALGPPRRSAEHAPLVALADQLLLHGRPGIARRILNDDPGASSLREIWVKARLDLSGGRVNEAHANLRFGLTHAALDASPLDAEVGFDGWALLSRLCLQLGDQAGARDAWRAAGRYLDRGDLVRRAAFHQGASACAAHSGRDRAVAAHLRRAAPMLESLGQVKEAACVWTRLGEVEARLGHKHQAVQCCSRAAHQHAVVGAHAPEVHARLTLGRTYLSCSCFDQAVEHLDRALDVATAQDLGPISAEIHMVLASAHRGRGDLGRERFHAGKAASATAAPGLRMRANATLAAADLRAGAPGAMRLLERCERDLRTAGLLAEADEAHALLVDARLRTGDTEAVAQLLGGPPTSARRRLGRARLDLLRGRDPQASIALEHMASDASLSLDLRTVAYAHLAEALRRQGRLLEARAAAVSASALLEVQHRSRRDDLRIHRTLARVFREVGDQGRSAGHLAAARRLLRALLTDIDPRESLRIARAQWRTDPDQGVVRTA